MNRSLLKTHKIGVLCGGMSRERDVSLRSGENVYRALVDAGYDCVKLDLRSDNLEEILHSGLTLAYIALHGQYGEDGCVQGFLELMGIPYTGSGVLASALGMNKIATKRILREVGIRTPDFRIARANALKVAAEMSLPAIVKPASEGSSINISIVRDKDELEQILAGLLEDYDEILVEEYIQGQEVTTGVLGQGSGAYALPVLELVPGNDFYDYDAKYTSGKTEFILPARLDEKTYREVQQTAVEVHQATGCRGVSRVDAIVDAGGKIHTIEINTAPGMTATSDLPAQAAEAGMDFEELVTRILLYALDKNDENQKEER